MKKLAPGVYDDERGGMHLDLGERLEGNGFADTPENRALLEQMWRKWCTTNGTALQVTAAPIGFTCPRCGAVSFNPTDLAQRYCGRCHVFVDDPGL